MLRLIRERYHPMHRLRGTRWFRWWQARLDFPVWVRAHGMKVAARFWRDFPVVMGRVGEEPEVEEAIRMIMPVLRPGQFLDVGANLGFYSWFVRSIVPECEITMFEPDPDNVALLKRTIARNELVGVELVEAAVCDRSGEREFLRDDLSGKAGGVVDTRSNEASIQAVYRLQERIRVRTVTLDALARERGRSTLLKIDVEGAERLVLAGAEHFIEWHRPTMVVEAFEFDWVEGWCSSRNYGWTALDRKSNHLLIPREHGALQKWVEGSRWKIGKK